MTRQDQLLSRLLDLIRQHDPLPCLSLRAVHAHTIKAFDVSEPVIALPLQGRKRALDGERWISVEPGEIFLATGPRSVDVENIPDAQTGEYVAIGIALDKAVLEAARHLMRERPKGEPGQIASVPIGDLCEPLLAWCEALQAGDITMACHAMQGVVMRLHAMGYHSLLSVSPPTLASRIRGMVLESPAREWSSSDIEAALGMSGASLRRHLAAEGASLREIIVDARLAHALNLFYTTRLPIKAVAQRVGYASATSFSKRFTERYGVEPSRVGNA